MVMRKTNFIKKGISFALAAIMTLSMASPMAESKAQTTTDNSYDVSEFRSTDAYTYPSKEGYVFAGWYTDADYQTPLGEDVVTGNAYAKFVSEDVLQLKFQLPITLSETDTTTAIRIITSVDSIYYQSVGFKVEYTENETTKTREFTTKNVYSLIKGSADGRVTLKYKAKGFSDDSTYLMALIVKNIPMTVYNSGLNITAQWVTRDGTTVSGETRTLSGTSTESQVSAGLYTMDFVDREVEIVDGGKYEKAFVTNHVSGPIPVLSGYDFGSDDFAISTWFKTPSEVSSATLGTGPNNYLFGIGAPNTEKVFSVQLKRTGTTPQLRINNLAKGVKTVNIADVTTYAADTWMHLAVVRSGDTLQVYLDGVSVYTYDFSSTAYAGIDFGTAKLAFGAYAGFADNYHNASMSFDDIRLYAKTLTADQILAIKNGTDVTTDEETETVTYSPEQPAAHLTFDDGTIANTGSNSSIKCNLYKIDASKNFVKTTEFVATGGVVPYDVDTAVGITTSGKYGEGFRTNHRQEAGGVAAVLDGYNFGTDDFTVSCWFMAPNIDKLSGGSQSYLFGINNPGASEGFSVQVKKANIRIKVTDNAAAVPGASLKSGSWHHVALVRSGDVIKVYFDGVQKGGDLSIGDSNNFGNTILSFGSLPGWENTPYTNNEICYDDIRVYNGALDATDITNLTSDTALTSTAELKAHVTFDDGIVANTGTDSSITAGLYKMTANYAPNEFVECNAVTGRDDVAYGATSVKHTEGPYTVLNGYELGTNDFTVSTYFNVPEDSTNLSSSAAGTYLFGTCNPDGSDGFAISIKSGNIRLKLNGMTKQPTCTFEKGTWYKVALTRIEDTVTVYCNDTALGSYTIEEDYDFGTKQLAFGGYYGWANNFHGNTMLFDDMEVTLEGTNVIPTSTKEALKPIAEVMYTNKTVTNTGTDSSLSVGTYKLDTSPDATEFVSTSASFTTGMEGDANGAITMKHNAGAYTVISGHDFGTNDFTISTWFNIPLDASQTISGGAGTYLFGTAPSGGNGTTGFSVCLKEGILRLQVGEDSETSDMPFEKNTWNNLMLRREGSTLEVYFNGSKVSTTLSAEGCDFGSVLSFGGYINNGSNYHSNSMCYDNIQVYDEAIPTSFINYYLQTMEHKVAWMEEPNHEMTTLFIGDSFFSERSYWTDFYDTYADKDVYCAGIASTTTYDWDVFADSYLAYTNPKNLVVHLGTYNIHDDGDSAKDAAQNVQALLTKIHKLDNYDDTQIYYFGIPYKKSTMYGEGNAFSEDYKTRIDTANALMEEWCAEKGWATYIGDLTGGAIADSQYRDNTLLSLTSYSLVTDAITKAGVAIEEDSFNFEAETTYRTRDSLSSTAKTLSTWLYLPETYSSRGGAIWSNYESDATSFINYEINTNGKPRLLHVNYATGEKQKDDLVFDQVDVRSDTWVNLTFVIGSDNVTVDCYLNGELKQTLTSDIEINLDDITQVYTLGGWQQADNAQYFKGRIKELALYEGTLTAEQVNALYTTGLGSTSVAPFTYYRLQDNTEGADVSDVKAANDLVARGRYFTEQVPVEDYAYSFAVIGDPQIISINDNKYGNNNLTGIYDWIIENQSAKNIQYVFNMGDITDGNLPAEWEAAQTQNARLANAGIPYSVLRGNHDLVGYNKQESVDYFSNYMGTDAYKAQFGGFYEDGDISNSWTTLTIGEMKYLLLTLDYGVVSDFTNKNATDENKVIADAILAWAGNVITTHSDHKVILTTHAYMNNDGTTLDYDDASNPSQLYGTYDGDELWDKFISQYENIVLVMSGHIESDEVVVKQEEGKNGNLVTSMLINFQGVDRYDELTGMVTMLYFSEDGKRMQVECYSTVQDAYFLERNQFTLDLVEPEVDITFKGGKVLNYGSNTGLTVGTYKINSTNDGFEASTDTIFTAGIDGDANGALKMKHDHLRYDNAGSYPVVKDYALGTKDFTISTWFYIPADQTISSGSNTYLFGVIQPNGTTDFSVCLKSSSVRFRVNSANASSETISVAYEKWHQMVLCRQGTSLKLYYDGVLVSSATLTEGYDFGTVDLAFGGYHGFVSGTGAQNYYQNSWICYDNIQMYNTVLTSEQIAAWYARGK